MRNPIPVIIGVVLLLSMQSSALAQTSFQEHDDSRHIDLKVHFVVNRNALDTAYDYNGYYISKFLERIGQLKQDSLATFTRAEVVGSASPEGYQDRNMGLSISRAKVLKSLIEPHLDLPSYAWFVSGVGSNWKELEEYSLKLGSLYHQEVVNIIKTVDFRDSQGSRKQTLMQLRDGYVWQLLGEEVFPELRKATLSLHYYTSPVPGSDSVSVPVPMPQTAVQDTVQSAVPAPAGLLPKKVCFALKSNLLYDICLTPTIGIEIPFGDKFSLAGEWSYAWWSNDAKQFCVRSYGGDASLRWWFGRKPDQPRLTGHHLGLYGQMFTFDYMLNGEHGIQAAKWNYAAGLEYGYSLPLISNSLNLDFTIGVGHIWGEYDSYWQQREGDEFRYIRRETLQYPAVFPTKAEISLVWLIK